MAYPTNINGSMPDEPDEVWLPCYRCENWHVTPTDERWGMCLTYDFRDGLCGEYTQRNEGCWVQR